MVSLQQSDLIVKENLFQEFELAIKDNDWKDARAAIVRATSLGYDDVVSEMAKTLKEHGK